MSAVGNAGASPGRPVARDEAPGRWSSFGGGLRLLAGWFSVAIAILNLLVDLDHAPDRAYLLFHAMLLAGGSLLISLSWSAAGAGPVSCAAGAALLAGGMLFSALPVIDAVCCMTTYPVRHGYPFTFLARNDGGSWHVDHWHLLADLLFWAYAGLVLLVLSALARRATRARAPG
ncbi:hypothetical protein [Actinoplanes auranticolor]|uniref:Uncharacterized protein n=1 Tax=Actinoplanes auranticolor TaxID=47988 RepID=A0A919VUA8_9ACTN|nr:hypothetical protein [Actinoplanes auranticolor]GIM79194.1 hypothetical protein Aau02nite_84550 [Actinoplanes auranticolor]